MCIGAQNLSGFALFYEAGNTKKIIFFVEGSTPVRYFVLITKSGTRNRTPRLSTTSHIEPEGRILRQQTRGPSTSSPLQTSKSSKYRVRAHGTDHADV